MPNNRNSNLPLHTLDDSGNPPKSRLENADEVQALVDTLLRANDERSKTDGRIYGLVSGNPPYRHSLLKKNAQTHRTNVNWRIGRAMINTALTAYHDVIYNAPFFCMVRTGFGNENEQEEWSAIITEQFEWLNNQDASLKYMFELSQHDMVTFRFGPVMWADPLDFRAKAVPQKNVLVPDGTKSNVNDWEFFIDRTPYSVHDLYAKIVNEQAAEAAGWNVELVKKAIMLAAPDAVWSGNTRYDWLEYYKSIVNNDLTQSARSDVVPISFVFYREFPKAGEDEGKISVAAVLERESLTAEKQKAAKEIEANGFLYRSLNRYDNWRQVMCPFYANRGDGTHHSVKGIGIELFSGMEAYNRLMCHLMDSTFFATSQHFQAQSDSQAQNLAIQNMGPWLIYPPGIQHIQMPNQGVALEAAMVVKQDLLRTMTSNTNQYRAQVDQKQGNPVTAQEINYRMVNESVITQSQMNTYFAQLDDFWGERFRRASNPELTKSSPGGALALEFQKRCLDRGVPKEALTQIESVKATRTIGSGNAASRRVDLDNLMQVYPLLPVESGKQRLLEDVIAARAGYPLMRRYMPKMGGLSKDEQEQLAFAKLQVAGMKAGVPPMVTDSQTPFIYATEFLNAASQAAASLRQGGNPSDVFNFIQMAGPAIAQHLQRMAKDPTRKKDVAALTEQWKKLGAIADQIGRKMQQDMRKKAQQRQQVAQQGMMQNAEMILKAKDQRDKIQLQAAKTQAQMQMKAAKTKQDMQERAVKARQDLQIKDLTTAAKIRQQTKQAAAKAAQAKPKKE